jgi:hypothetical protein
MATDGQNPAPCQDDIYKDGVTLEVFGDVGGSNRFEQLVQEASKKYGARMDWHFAGGRAVLKCMADDMENGWRAVEEFIRPVLRGEAPTGVMAVKNERPDDTSGQQEDLPPF